MLLWVLLVELGGVHGHRAVEVDGNVRDEVAPAQPGEVQHQGLGPAHGEGCDHDDAVALRHAAHHLAERLRRVVVRVCAVSVGRLGDEHVRRFEGRGRVHERIVLAAEVPREVDGALLGSGAGGDVHLGRTEDVSRRDEPDLEPGPEAERLAELAGVEVGEGVNGVPGRVQGLRIAVPRRAAPPGCLGLLLLEVPAVRQEERAQVRGAGRGVHRTAESALHEGGDVARVVEVGVGEHDGVDRLGRDRQGRAVALAQLLVALEETAVHEDPLAAVLEEVPGTGHRIRRAEEAQVRTAVVLHGDSVGGAGRAATAQRPRERLEGHALGAT